MVPARVYKRYFGLISTVVGNTIIWCKLCITFLGLHTRRTSAKRLAQAMLIHNS